MNRLWIGVLGYIGLQFLIGAWMSRRVRDESDYLLAGRQLGLILASFSIFATWFGAETVVGAAGRIYADGLAGGSADPFGYVLCIVGMGLFFAQRLWRRGLTTFADLFRERYSPGVERLAVILMVPSSVIWAAAQIRAFGQVLSSSTDWDVEWTLGIATSLVIAYTAVGGLLADAWTDLVQGVSLIVGLLVIGISLYLRADLPPDQLDQALSAPRLALLSLPEHTWHAWLTTSESWAVPIFGSVFAVELISRVLACQSAATARNACLLGGALYLGVGLIPVAIGLVGPSLQPGLEDPEQLIPRLAQLHLGGWGFTLFAGALISAILSTVDSSLLAASALLSHNLILHRIDGVTEATKVRVARSGVVVLGIVAYVLARRSGSIHELIEDASAFGSAGIAVVTTLALTTRWGGPLAAHAALWVGMFVWAVGEYLCEMSAPYLAALLAATLAYAFGAYVESKPSVAAEPLVP